MISEEVFTMILATATLVAHIGAILFFIAHFLFKQSAQKFSRWIAKNALIYAFTTALLAMLGSLYYSDVLGLAPCTLCWYQRIFMYPLVFLFGMAMLRKDWRNILPYAKFLAWIGLFIALYHSAVQYIATHKTDGFAFTCSISSTVSCADSYFVEFGYITIPVISATAFLIVLMLLHILKRYERVH